MPSTNPAAISIDPAVLGQLAYHVNCVAHLAGERDLDAAATHAGLSWALLQAMGGDQLEAAVGELDLPDSGAVGTTDAGPARRRARDLALQLCSHFTSEGQYRLAQLYQDACHHLDAAG